MTYRARAEDVFGGAVPDPEEGAALPKFDGCTTTMETLPVSFIFESYLLTHLYVD